MKRVLGIGLLLAAMAASVLLAAWYDSTRSRGPAAAAAGGMPTPAAAAGAMPTPPSGLAGSTEASLPAEPSPPPEPWRKPSGPCTLADVLRGCGPAARARLQPFLDRAGLAWPPREVRLLALKQERQLELWARGAGPWVHVRTYPILAASGRAGPKLREGDRQVPEGDYRVIFLNPNSRYHLSMQIDYPNDFDRQMADRDGRTNLGGEIFIHGRAASIGCLAVGDVAIEELFVLAATVGIRSVGVLIAPSDMRGGRPAAAVPGAPAWVGELHAALREELAAFERPAAEVPRER